MVNDRYDDGYEGQEEGEYHFSDDQASYDMDIDATQKAAPVAAMPIAKESLLSRLKQSRRTIIGVVVFLLLLGIVYKMVVPSTTTPSTEFSQQSTMPAAGPAKAAPQQMANPTAAPIVPAVQQAQSVPAAAPQANVMPQQEQAAAAEEAVPAAATEQQNKSPMDRLAAVEQQNTAIMNVLETQYAQKLAEYETQNNELRTQVQELNARIASMEVSFRQLTKILRGMNKPVAMDEDSAVPVRSSAQPKMSYTVQAIIPGRAWLKSDSGDTVTVAEGDVLRGYGRITKIDPYDGIVSIDTGGKVLTLSYGVSGE